jgi:hypothetical protein
MATSAVILVLATFLASAVEAVEHSPWYSPSALRAAGARH